MCLTFTKALREHWPEYLIEAALLGAFMISAAMLTALLEYPGSPVHDFVSNPNLRRALIGIAMGVTAIALIYSPWGQRSGAHMNPATTLAFLSLRKIETRDATFYILAQFIGGVCGVLVSRFSLSNVLAHPSVNYMVTVPGAAGVATAFIAETAIAGGMMLMVLFVTNTAKVGRYTGLFAGTLVALYITFEAPFSGMSMNPARTFASALPSGTWTSAWIYFTAPLLGMLAATKIHGVFKKFAPTACPKLHHGTSQRCIFCGHPGRQSLAQRQQRTETPKCKETVHSATH